MTFIKIKEFIVDDILDKVNASEVGLEISVFLASEYGMSSEGYVSAYTNRLVNEGLISLHQAAGFTRRKIFFAKLTEKGKVFIESGGYLGKRFRDIEARKNSKKGFITENKREVELVFIELERLEEETRKITSELGSGQDKNRIFNTVTLLINRIFLPGHEIHCRSSFGVITVGDLLDLIEKAKVYIKFHKLQGNVQLDNLHEEIIKVSEKLFLNGHYREAVNNAFTAVNEYAKLKYQPVSKGKLMDGSPMFEHLLNSNDNRIRFSEDKEKQDGIKMVYVGANLAFRNQHIHNLKEIKDPKYAIELLHYASLLIRLLEDPKFY